MVFVATERVEFSEKIFTMFDGVNSRDKLKSILVNNKTNLPDLVTTNITML